MFEFFGFGIAVNGINDAIVIALELVVLFILSGVADYCCWKLFYFYVLAPPSSKAKETKCATYTSNDANEQPIPKNVFTKCLKETIEHEKSRYYYGNKNTYDDYCFYPFIRHILAPFLDSLLVFTLDHIMELLIKRSQP